MMNKQTILGVLNETLSSVTTENISREEIFNLLQGKISKGEVIKVLKDIGSNALLKKNPIVYRVNQLKDQPSIPDYELQVVPTPPTTNELVVGGPELENTYESVDATCDPAIDKFFPTKSYKHLKKRMNAEHPVNVFVWGETGVGKSAAAIHIAKSQGRNAIRVSLSKFSDADDLFGGMRITNGSTYFEQGPALIAMQLGAVLILDEVDSADPQLLTDLHPLLERRGYLVKKMKKMVYPAPGFCVVGTANTKGRGDLTGKYIGTGALNRAFLDRFATGV